VLISFLLTPTTALALTALVAHLSGALHYEAVHFGVHTRVTPKGRFYQRLWQNHRLHHFKNEKFWYGVTRLEGDRLLGTGPDPATVALSPTARTLAG
jgi:sterol desaturase/sphingolipid hydroxylase (fatty acid hydroxylase superfamily)